MTYRRLLTSLESLNEEQLDQDVSIALLDSTEVIAAFDFVDSWCEHGDKLSDYEKAIGLDFVMGILDENHPYLTVVF